MQPVIEQAVGIIERAHAAKTLVQIHLQRFALFPHRQGDARAALAAGQVADFMEHLPEYLLEKLTKDCTD